MAAPAGVNEGLPPELVVQGAGNAEASAEPAVASPAEPTIAVPEPAEPVETAASAPEELTGPAAGSEGGEPVEVAAVPEPEPEGPARLAAVPGAGAADGEAANAKSGRDLGPLAITGIALGIIALMGVAVGVLAVATHGFHRKTVVTYRPAAVFSLRPGDCINSGPNGLAVTRVSCATPHDAEVFATFPLPGRSWPGETAAQQQAGSGCASRLSGYLNPQLSGAGLAQEFVYPDRTAWQAGERTVVCEIGSSTGRLAGSVRAGG